MLSHMGKFSPVAVGILAFGLGFKFWGWYLDFRTGISALRLRFRHQGWDLGLLLGFGPKSSDLGLKAGNWALRMGFGPWCLDFGLEARIWVSRMGFGFQGWDLVLEAGGSMKEKEEKFPHIWKHRSSAPLGPLLKNSNHLQAAVPQRSMTYIFTPHRLRNFPWFPMRISIGHWSLGVAALLSTSLPHTVIWKHWVPLTGQWHPQKLLRPSLLACS